MFCWGFVGAGDLFGQQSTLIKSLLLIRVFRASGCGTKKGRVMNYT